MQDLQSLDVDGASAITPCGTGGREGPASQRTSALIKAGGGSSQILPVAIIQELSARQVSLNDFEDARCGWNAVPLSGRYGDD